MNNVKLRSYRDKFWLRKNRKWYCSNFSRNKDKYSPIRRIEMDQINYLKKISLSKYFYFSKYRKCVIESMTRKIKRNESLYRIFMLIKGARLPKLAKDIFIQWIVTVSKLDIYACQDDIWTMTFRVWPRKRFFAREFTGDAMYLAEKVISNFYFRIDLIDRIETLCVWSITITKKEKAEIN